MAAHKGYEWPFYVLEISIYISLKVTKPAFWPMCTGYLKSFQLTGRSA